MTAGEKIRARWEPTAADKGKCPTDGGMLERLTRQILVALQTLLETENVAVSITATHYCVKARAVEDPTSSTTTTALGGFFKKNSASRHEFLTDD